MYHSGVSASSAWSSQIHQRPPHSLLYRHHQYHRTRMSPLPPIDSPTTESDPKKDPEEYEDDETEDGPIDYPIDWGDNGDDDDGDSSGDDADDEDEDEEDKEHLAPSDSVIVIPTVELAAISLPLEAEVKRLIAMPTPPPSPFTSLSPPTAGERLDRYTTPFACPSPPPIPSPLLPSSGCPTQIETLRMASTQALIDAVTAALPSPPLPPMTVREVNTRVKEFVELHKHDTHDLYALLADAQDSRTRISQRVYTYEFQLQADQTQLQLQGTLIRTQHQLHETRFQMQQAEIAELRETDHRSQAQMVETLRVMGDMRREMGDMQAELLALREQIMAHVTRQGPNIPPNNTNSNNMTLESVQAMIDQALLRNSTNEDGSHSSHEDNQRNMQTACPCFYADFIKCQPLNFKGTEGVVGITWWIEKTELVFQISGCAIENQEVLKKKITNKYCPQGEIKKLEIKLWNLKVKGNDVPAYTERFQELSLMCTKFVANKTEKIDKYIDGLPDNIYGSVKGSKPRTLDETIDFANDLMDQKLRTYAERQMNNKRKANDSFKQPWSSTTTRQEAEWHFARDCKSSGNTNVANAQRGNGEILRGMVVLNVELHGISREITLS
nr:hypothetical protein [Tanacetum cinerariifolium]